MKSLNSPTERYKQFFPVVLNRCCGSCFHNDEYYNLSHIVNWNQIDWSGFKWSQWIPLESSNKVYTKSPGLYRIRIKHNKNWHVSDRQTVIAVREFMPCEETSEMLMIILLGMILILQQRLCGHEE